MSDKLEDNIFKSSICKGLLSSIYIKATPTMTARASMHYTVVAGQCNDILKLVHCLLPRLLVVSMSLSEEGNTVPGSSFGSQPGIRVGIRRIRGPESSWRPGLGEGSPRMAGHGVACRSVKGRQAKWGREYAGLRAGEGAAPTEDPESQSLWWVQVSGRSRASQGVMSDPIG